MAEGVRIPIPPGAELVQPYPVHLPQFDGPLDLLLHLIRKNEVDLRNIPVADICRQYHEYLVLMVELDLEVAAEFLYVEALLVQVKSQLVLPRTPAAGGGEAPDPREELIARLLQYRKFKGVAETLHVYEMDRIGMYPRPAYRPEAEPEEEEERAQPHDACGHGAHRLNPLTMQTMAFRSRMAPRSVAPTDHTYLKGASGSFVIKVVCEKLAA